ncbi:hypothetical protein HHI36_001255 [Cryptolaemus montrouzieri]|uniref:Uncharacterized protein n=1 Tax=Cryptolaemus montrouzieri TaxID=559131 RepID=A0ABD2P724_9CUCU
MPEVDTKDLSSYQLYLYRIVSAIISGGSKGANRILQLYIATTAHSEKPIRELALRRVLKAGSEKTQNLRLFQVPEGNMDANVNYDLINWQAHVTEPPIL